MVLVTDKQFFMEKFLKEKLDLMIQRVTKRKLDAVLMIDGDEGFGKTGLSILLAYYFSQETGRPFSLDNIFFDPEEFMNFINTTKEQIIIWDEAALGGLASGWQNKIQQVLIQTLMTCRFRKHIIIFNCPKFYRLNQYFVMERALGLCHVYSRDGLQAGRMTYHLKDMLEKMLDLWYKKRIKPYKKYTRSMLRGSFVDAFNLDIINEDDYEKKKTKYTKQLLDRTKKEKVNKEKIRLEELQMKVAKLDIVTQEELAEKLGISSRTLRNWKNLKENQAIQVPT